MASGTLLVVASPIGNMEDLSPRARRALEEADLVIAEDTRRTGRLLEAFGLDRPLTSCHKFNEASRTGPLIEVLKEGRCLALISDGGTPAISDPGRRLVSAALDAGASVTTVPGPSAVTAALSISGFPGDRFLFWGFLPAKTAERRRDLAQLASFGGTIVLFEAPHRLLACLEDIEQVFAPRLVAVCREMTKRFEEVLRANPGELRRILADRGEVRGECVVVIGPNPDAPDELPFGGAGAATLPAQDRDAVEAFDRALNVEEGDPRRALKRAARELGISRAELKRRLDRSR